MDKLTGKDQAEFAVIEAALRTYPLKSPSAGFADAVMTRIETLPGRPRFRLSWLDAAGSLLLSGLGGSLILLWQMIPPQEMARLRMTFLLAWQRLQPVRLELALAAGGVAVAMMLLILGILLVQARYRLEANG